MKRALPWVFLIIGIALLIQGMLPKRYATGFDVKCFAMLPIQEGGRIKPLDTLARNTLILLSGRQSIKLPDGARLDANTWMMEVALRSNIADQIPVFRIDNADILGLWGEAQSKQKYYSYLDLEPHFGVINEQAQAVDVEPQARSVFEKKLIQLHESLTLYHKLVHSFHPLTRSGDELEMEYAVWLESIHTGLDAIRLQQEGKPFDEEALNRFMLLADRYLELAKLSEVGITPPPPSIGKSEDDWNNIGQSLLDTILVNHLDPITLGYAKLLTSYNTGDVDAFNETLTLMHERTAEEINPGKLKFEYFFNNFQPFYRSLELYLMVALLAFFSWLGWARPLQRSAFWLLILALLVHTFGLIARMYIQGRPPVTNLYSSAIFVGWAAVLLSVFLERIYKNGVGSAVAGMIGFSTLIIAHQLSTSGDTLEMMRAVLDSNFWLSTHVVTVTLGYSAMFLSGMLAFIYIVRGVFTRTLTKEDARALTRMAYGTLCFATLFSFVGTMLGGIWADQSWGRFWGWDTKENGALIIVLWCALVLHARLGGMIRQRGFMVACIFGNIITSWSWFGTNMLGVGLHSYGFIDRAFWALVLFMGSQVLLMMLGLLPNYCWRSKLH